MLYRTIKRLIELNRREGLAEKMDIFFAANKLSEEEYADLVSLLG